MRKSTTALALWVIFPFCLTGGAERLEAATDSIQEIVLENGFRVLVVEKTAVPRVAASLWYRVGGIAEAQGEHGSTHFLEHMIHQGTTTVGTRDFAAEKPILREIYETEQKLIEVWNRERNRLRERNVFYDELDWPTTPEMVKLRQRLYELEDQDSELREFWAEYNWYRRYGGRARHADPVPATTGNEHMDISLDLPKENLELLFRLEAERMVNAVLRGWEAQRFTVFEQILNSHSRPERGRFYQAINGVTGLAHPIYLSAGGHMRDFAYFNRASMLRMYEKYFVPGNATLVLVGDVALGQVRSLAERYFGRIPKGAEAPARMDYEAEPVPGGAARLDWLEPLDPRVIIRFRIPGVGHPDRPAFDALAALLRGRHGVLARALRLREGGSRDPFREVDFQASAPRSGSPRTISLVARARRDDDLPKLEQMMLAALEELRQGKLASGDLNRARKAMRLQWEQIRSSRGNLASELGRFQVMDSWRTLEPYMDAREKASIEDIRRVAERYLVPANRTIATSRRNPAPNALLARTSPE